MPVGPLIRRCIGALSAFDSVLQQPLYRLRAAQTALKNAVPQLARVYVLNWKRYWATVRTCKLYDYANHRWLDFKGRVTAAPLFPDTQPAAT